MATKYTVTAKNGLMVRTGPSKNYKSIGAKTYKTIVTVYNTKNGWAQISKTAQQWMSLDYLKKATTSGITASTVAKSITDKNKALDLQSLNGVSNGTSDIDYYSGENDSIVSESYIDSSSKNKEFDRQMRLDLNMQMEATNKNQTYFDRLYSIYPEIELDNICQYIFLIRPDLNLYKDASGTILSASCSKNPLMRYMHATHPKILKQLSTALTTHNDFMPYLVGRTEALQIPDYTVKNYSINQPFTNLQIPYGGHALESMTGGTFDLTLREDNNFLMHKLFQVWLTYIDGVSRNLFVPKKTYIKDNKIDYATSAYCITCAADAQTILYWSKYTGAFPTTNPNSDLSFNLRGAVPTKINIPFNYFLCESLDPFLLADFNQNAHVLTSAQTTNAANSYDDGIVGMGYGLVGSPFIYRPKKTGPYKLGWKKKTG